MSVQLALTLRTRVAPTVDLGTKPRAAPALFGGSGRLCLRQKERRVTRPPSPPRRPRTVAGTRAAGVRQERTGGRFAGTAYPPPQPAEAGGGARFPFQDYSGVEPRPLRESYEWWQDIACDV